MEGMESGESEQQSTQEDGSPKKNEVIPKSSSAIKPIERNIVHRICSGQVLQALCEYSVPCPIKCIFMCRSLSLLLLQSKNLWRTVSMPMPQALTFIWLSMAAWKFKLLTMELG